MKRRSSLFVFWGVFSVVTAAHIALLSFTLKPSPSAPVKPVKKIHISLAVAPKKATVQKAASGLPKAQPKRKPPVPKKKRPQPEKKTVQSVPLEKTQLLSSPPLPEPASERVSDTPETEVATVTTDATGSAGDGTGNNDSNAAETGASSAAAAEANNVYISYLRDRLIRLRHYPYKARKMRMEGRVDVTFVILPDGRVQSVRISRRCPYRVLNEGTEKAIRNITRFRPLPPELGREPIEVTVPFVYQLK